MELETALQVSEDWEGVDLDEKLNNLQTELMNAEEKLQELKKTEIEITLCLGVKDDELDDARKELIDEIKTRHKRNNICVKTVNPGNEKCTSEQKLWNKKEDREATLKECIEPMLKKWKTEKKQLSRD
ncbi:uncharacterized protein [Rutidosis leptorrhynchoides]|uniref:uncharacterized protein n=1 Tax=Rutidosis leptorrhynchoides TaxID=125765 RepID=UPI003A98F79C